MIDKWPDDGTDQLLTVLYGESSARTIGYALGGSNARMLRDAAKCITDLRAILEELDCDSLFHLDRLKRRVDWLLRCELAIGSLAARTFSPGITIEKMVADLLGEPQKEKEKDTMKSDYIEDKGDNQAEISSPEGRRKATDEMRARAVQLEKQARGWRSLANALDEIEEHAISSQPDGCEGAAPYIGVGSAAENFLWALACGHIK